MDVQAPKSYEIRTYGCQMNVHDSERLSGLLEEAGYVRAPEGTGCRLFYAHLYLGLYFDALGNRDRAFEHITEAASDRYAAVGGYMHAVARIHLDALRGVPKRP